MNRSRAWRVSVVAGVALSAVILASVAGWAQESVAVRAALVKDNLPAEDPTAAAWSSAPVSEFPCLRKFTGRLGFRKSQSSR